MKYIFGIKFNKYSSETLTIYVFVSIVSRTITELINNSIPRGMYYLAWLYYYRYLYYDYWRYRCDVLMCVWRILFRIREQYIIIRYIYFVADVDPPGPPQDLKVSSLKWTNKEYQQCVLSWAPPAESVLPVRKYKVFISVRDGPHVYHKRNVVPAVSLYKILLWYCDSSP